MPSFRKSSSQAKHMVLNNLALRQSRHENKADNLIHSVGSMRNYESVLKVTNDWLISTGNPHGLANITPELAIAYLDERSEYVVQKSLDLDRQALQLLPLMKGYKLPRIKSLIGKTGTLANQSRAYTHQQLSLIKKHQSEKHSFSTELAAKTGIRGHELYTLRKVEVQPRTSNRNFSDKIFSGLKGEIYTVVGKGGLIREICIPTALAVRLESKKLDAPKMITDRKVVYLSHYDVVGGQAWSQSFSSTSNRLFDWSNGAHGTRHGYAQQRMDTLQGIGFIYNEALEIVSHEMGHFRLEITETYLR